MPRVRADKYIAQMCRESYYQFFLEMWETVDQRKLVRNWHIEKLCNEIQEISERIFLDKPKDHDTIVNCPPGMTKSKMVSVLWQPWAWTRMPACRFITGSYTDRLTLDFARQSRDCILSEKYQSLFPGINLRDDQNTKGLYMNTEGGWRFSTSVGGSATGFHAHIIAIDDPVDPLGAMSPIVLNEANTWMSETLSDRKVDKEVSTTFLIMQRLHQDDPTGNWLNRSQGTRLRHIVLPADTDYDIKPEEWKLLYKQGLLDPNRLPRSVLEEAMKRGEAYYAGQYGQNPVPRGGAMFKVDRLNFSSHPPQKWKRGPWRYWDKAGTHGRGAYTVGVKGGLDFEDKIWILDVRRGQWDSGERERIIDSTAIADGKECWQGFEQEPAASGKESAENTVRRLAKMGYRARMDPARGDKEIRADTFSVQVNLGDVILVSGLWNHAYVEEMRFFPRSKYKDQVDASSGLCSMLIRPKIKVGALR